MTQQKQVFSGAPEGFDANIVAAEAAGGVIHIARDGVRLEAMRAALGFFAPHIPVFVFPAWDCLPYDRTSPHSDIAAQRMAALAGFMGEIPKSYIVLTTAAAITQKLPPQSALKGAIFCAKLNSRVDKDHLRMALVKMGFNKTSTVMEPGDYAIRGGIVDIFPAGHDTPIRLDFFGDMLDAIRRFDPQTQRTLDQLQFIELAPVSEVILDAPAITRFRQNYRIEFGAAGSNDPLYESISNERKYQGAEHWLPLFYDELESLFSYLPQASVVSDDQAAGVISTRWDLITDQYEVRKIAHENAAKTGQGYNPIAPDTLYLDPDTVNRLFEQHRHIQISALPLPVGLNVIDKGARIGRSFAPERQNQSTNLFEVLARHVSDVRKNRPVVIACYSDGSLDRLSGLVRDEGLVEQSIVNRFAEINNAGLYLCVLPLDHGFETDDFVFISEQDILGDRLVRPRRKNRKAENFLTEVQALSIGDLVVHVDHGVGRFVGMEIISIAGAAHECLHLEYAYQTKLYLPVENIELLSRYGHEEGQLDRLGGGAWQAKKAALKQRIRDMVEKLIRVAAERELRSAPILERPAELWESFAAHFPFQETDDQLDAIDAVIDDLGRGRPMDRLICGDVGFGKTEVAMRGAFVAALCGMQVAVIAPTTLLARQHTKSFMERFRGFPIEVRQLSRFVTAKQAADTRQRLADGTVDIVIGTHAVLAKAVKFKNLGLLVIDEEQRFGVSHKERLKQMRSDVHVLTLSATPIPRTLQLSLSGVRDLSIIGTPPVDRLAIRTYISEFAPVTVREALLREKYRGGQSFFVVPRIADMAEMKEFLRDHVPEVKFATAHAQMPAGELDDKMNAFYDGQYDVLLSTTIVESGLDIPNANTMIIHHADKFGLAQLYQIRGRVGRSKIRAFAYLTTKPRKKITDGAQKRLRVLGSLDTLGAGFTLAAQDLDIRGAGNLLGEEQSGQMRDVGYELYQQMLEDAVAAIKSGAGEDITETDQWAPQINLGVTVLIPEDYVPDLDLRLGLYRRLSHLGTKVELEGFAAELIDRFGPLPKEVNTLLLIVRIKAMCRRAGIAKLDGGPKGGTVQFHNDKFASPVGLVKFMEDQRGLAKVKDNKIIVKRDWAKSSDKIKGAFAIARDLAGLAKT